jgi:hypothetical protein
MHYLNRVLLFAWLFGFAALLFMRPLSANAETSRAPGLNVSGRWIIPANKIDSLVESGAAWIRLGIPWSVVEPQQDKYDWSIPDANIAALTSRGVQVLPVLQGAPCWATDSSKRSIGCESQIPDKKAWADFVYAIVMRYKSHVHAWEVWNEPDLNYFFAGSLEDYRNSVLIPAASAIRHADPAATVVGGALSAQRYSPQQLAHNVSVILSANAASRIDVLSIHSYKSAQEIIELGNATRQAMDKQGAHHLELWLTEYGAKWRPQIAAPDSQVAFFQTFNRLNDDQHIFSKVFWFQLVDMACSGPPEKQNCAQPYGLVNYDLSQRPVYKAFRDYSTRKNRKHS